MKETPDFQFDEFKHLGVDFDNPEEVVDFDPFSRMAPNSELISETYLADFKEIAIVCIQIGTAIHSLMLDNESEKSDEEYMQRAKEKLITACGHLQHWRAYADDESIQFVANSGAVVTAQAAVKGSVSAVGNPPPASMGLEDGVKEDSLCRLVGLPGQGAR